MTDRQISYHLSAELVRIVKKRYFLIGYGIKNCGDPHADGDLHDIYLRKQLQDNGFDCHVQSQTINRI